MCAEKSRTRLLTSFFCKKIPVVLVEALHKSPMVAEGLIIDAWSIKVFE